MSFCQNNQLVQSNQPTSVTHVHFIGWRATLLRHGNRHLQRAALRNISPLLVSRRLQPHQAKQHNLISVHLKPGRNTTRGPSAAGSLWMDTLVTKPCRICPGEMQLSNKMYGRFRGGGGTTANQASCNLHNCSFKPMEAAGACVQFQLRYGKAPANSGSSKSFDNCQQEA